METDARTFRNLEAWQRGMDLVLEVYRITAKMPSSERYDLSAQLRRAGVSIPSNVAEGHERKGKGYLYHLRVSLGSLAELETQTEIAVRLGFVAQADFVKLQSCAATVGRLLHGLRRSVRRRMLANAAEGLAIGALLAMRL
jgi:four helix bundle protein